MVARKANTSTRKKAPAKAKAQAVEAKLIAAMFALSASDQWMSLTLETIARKARVKSQDIPQRLRDRVDVVALWAEGIGHRIAGADTDKSIPLHDRLFEGVMAVLEAASDVRAGLGGIAAAVMQNPLAGIELVGAAAHLGRAAARHAGLDVSGIGGQASAVALGLLIARLLPVYAADEPGLGRTMALTDQNLSAALGLLNLVPRVFG